MLRYWKQIVLLVVALVTYCVLMSVRGDMTNPNLRTAAGVIAAVSMGIALVVSLRLGRQMGRTGRR